MPYFYSKTHIILYFNLTTLLNVENIIYTNCQLHEEFSWSLCMCVFCIHVLFMCIAYVKIQLNR